MNYSSKIGVKINQVILVSAWISFITAGVFLGSQNVRAENGYSDLLPHKAVYILRLKNTRQGAINNMSGQISYDWTSDCKGWLVKNELDMNVAYSTGQTVQMALNISTWEAHDGSRYRFAVQQGDSLAGSNQFIGNALRDSATLAVRANINEPRTVEKDLGPVLFPTAFLKEIIAVARAGEISLFRPVFDGTAELEAFNVSVLIIPHKNSADIPELSNLKSWKVFLAYYDLASTNTLPVQEQSLLLFENGVVTEIELNFGDFSVAGKLVEFYTESFPQCD